MTMDFTSETNAPHLAQVNPHGQRYQGLQELEAYWQALRAGRLVPLRSDLNPRGIENVLDEAFIIERIAPGIARIRVAGSHLNELVGMDVRGMPLTTLFTPNARNLIKDDVDAVFTGPKTMELKLSSETGIGKPALVAQMLLLPMRSDMGDITRALGVLVTRGRVRRGPRRFDLSAASKMGVLESGSEADGKPGDYKTSVPSPALQEKTIQELNRRVAAKKNPGAHLRLVHSAD